MTAAAAGRAVGLSARRYRGTAHPARPPRGARTGPGRYRRHPATARPPAAGRGGPSRPATPFCRTRPERRPAPGPVPAPHRAGPPAAGGARNPAAGRARAAWWPAAHPARPPQPPIPPPRAAQSPLTCTLTASSDLSCRCRGRPIIIAGWPAQSRLQLAHLNATARAAAFPGHSSATQTTGHERVTAGLEVQARLRARSGPAPTGWRRCQSRHRAERHFRARCRHRRFHPSGHLRVTSWP